MFDNFQLKTLGSVCKDLIHLITGMHQIWTNTKVPHFSHAFQFHIISMVHRYLWSNSKLTANRFNIIIVYENAYVPTGRERGLISRRLGRRGERARSSKRSSKNTARVIIRARQNETKQEHYASVMIIKDFGNYEFRTRVHQNVTNKIGATDLSVTPWLLY